MLFKHINTMISSSLMILLFCNAVLCFTKTAPSKIFTRTNAHAHPIFQLIDNKVYFSNNNKERNKAKDEHLDSVHDIVTRNGGYCFMATISKDSKIENYPFGSVTGYTYDKRGFPVLALSDISRHTKNLNLNSAVSLVLMDNNKINSAFHPRVVFTGNINKIQNDYANEFDFYKGEIPSDETVKYKNYYLESHPDAGWIEFPDINMYVMDNIKDIYYISGPASADKINVENYIKLFDLKR